MTVLAVDAGTTEIKAVAFDRDTGAERATAHRPNPVRSPRPERAEQDPEQVWRAVAETVREVAAGAGPVSAVAVTGQGDGCWLVGPDRRPVGPAVLWNDGRAAGHAAAWWQGGQTAEAFRLNGSVGFAGSPHAILAWLAEHEPDRLAAARAALTCTGWLFCRLTGEAAMDESEAAAPWLDLTRREYADRVLELFGMPWARRLLPPLRRPGDPPAPLHPEAAAELGLPAGVPVVMAPYDLVATSAGAGAVVERDTCVILGTTLSTQTVTAAPDLTGPPVGLTLPFGPRFLRALPTLAGTQVLNWAAALLQLDSAATLTALAAAARPGADGLLFLPYLSPAGERAPFLDPRARGGFVGLSFHHDRAAVARAVLEGLTYVVRECCEVAGLDPAVLYACGGGANSPQWCQLIADVVGAPVARPADRQVGARGAFCYALVATGEQPDLPAAVGAHVRTAAEVAPDAGRHRAYDDLFATFRAVRDESRTSWSTLAAAPGAA